MKTVQYVVTLEVDDSFVDEGLEYVIDETMLIALDRNFKRIGNEVIQFGSQELVALRRRDAAFMDSMNDVFPYSRNGGEG